jgi:hypothetical protein
MTVSAGLIRRVELCVTILDWDRLQREGEFDPDYPALEL